MKIGRHEVREALTTICSEIESDVRDHDGDPEAYGIGAILEAQILTEIERLLTVAGVQIEEPAKS